MDSYAQKHSEILEIGSGSGKNRQNTLYPMSKKIVGLDLDDRVLNNPFLDDAFNISAYQNKEKLPNVKFDIIYSQMVAEHIDDGEKFISVQLSALKDKGVLIHSTVSKYYWTSLINSLVPEGIKNWLIKELGSGRESDDVFPAHYKLNSKHQIEKICKKLNAKFKIIRQDEPPGYLQRSFILMLIYTMVHKPLQFVFPAVRPTFIFIVSKK
ncbi:MAG: class I SAM-dependent methyltransferase [Pirellulales bacterium]